MIFKLFYFSDMNSLRSVLPLACNNICRFLVHPNISLSVTRAASHLIGRTMQPSLAPAQQLLVPQVPILVPSCGMKVVGKLKKRCKDCYFVVRDERTYVICKSKPRHKQMSMKKKEEKSWILTYASQRPAREW